MTATYDIVQYDGLATNLLTGIAWNTFALPRWDGTNAAPQPRLGNNQGYDVTAPQLSHGRREIAYKKANGTLCDGTFWWPLFIIDVAIDIALAGSTAQARSVRDFYPHNFVQPSFVVQGQALDQRDYGALTDFVHQAQQRGLESGGVLMQLFVKGEGFDGSRSGHQGVTKNGTFHPNQAIRGSHQTILCKGYINAMPRRHQKWVYAPTYTFAFVVAEMITGPWHEDMVQVVQQQNWVDVLKSTETFQVDSKLMKENQKVLEFAKNNSANVISESSQ